MPTAGSSSSPWVDDLQVDDLMALREAPHRLGPVAAVEEVGRDDDPPAAAMDALDEAQGRGQVGLGARGRVVARRVVQA